MAGASKNSRTAAATQKFNCPCGGDIVLKTMVDNGKIKNVKELNDDLKTFINRSGLKVLKMPKKGGSF